MDDDDMPMTLQEACRVIFRDAIKPATLRIEADRGNLVLEKIGRRYFVTRRAIGAMREKCRVVPKRPMSSFDGGGSETESSAAAPRVFAQHSKCLMASFPERDDRRRVEAAQVAALESARALRQKKS